MAFVPRFWEGFGVDWDQVREQLRTVYRVIQDEPNMFAVAIPLKIQADEITQDLGFAQRPIRGHALLAMLAPICAAQRLEPRTIVELQDRLAFGAIVVRANTAYLRHDVLLGTLTTAALGWLATSMAHEAAALRVNLRAPAVETFAHYVE